MQRAAYRGVKLVVHVGALLRHPSRWRHHCRRRLRARGRRLHEALGRSLYPRANIASGASLRLEHRQLIVSRSPLALRTRRSGRELRFGALLAARVSPKSGVRSFAPLASRLVIYRAFRRVACAWRVGESVKLLRHRHIRRVCRLWRPRHASLARDHIVLVLTDAANAADDALGLVDAL